MRVHVVDPSAYTPPYDHALCQALGAAGLDVELFTSRFVYGAVAPAEGYERRELFYGRAHRGAASGPRSRLRLALKAAEHVPDMLRYRGAARAADIVHFQWLTVQPLDAYLLPRARPTAIGPRPRPTAAGVRPKLVLTAHDVLPREPRRGQLAAQRRLYERFDALVVHTAHGRARLVEELGVDAKRVHVIPHGAFAHLADVPGAPPAASAPPPHRAPPPHGVPPPHEAVPPQRVAPAVVLCFGLLRPYKGLGVLLDAWRGLETDAELWIAGMPRMDLAPLLAEVQSAPLANVRLDARFIPDAELPAYFRRADLVVLPYLEADQSGVLFTALAFGKPLLLSDVGGFPEIAATGAARTVPRGDSAALRGALQELLADPARLADMATRARAVAAGPYSWEAVAAAHVRLYEQLLAG
jgi:glycosyltransferase involved in cell wall biosynthesis